MLKVNNKIFENEFTDISYGDAFRMEGDNYISKIAPRISIASFNEDGDKISLMIEIFISEKEISSLILNEEVDVTNLVTDVIFVGKDTELLGNWDRAVKIKRISDDTINLTASIEGEFECDSNVYYINN